jgi:anaphase-promoting complex subunit 5
VANSLFSTCYKYNMQVENASVLLLLAEIQKNSDNAVLGLPYALASQSFCKSFNLDLLEASATLTLTELWLALGSTHAKRALSLVCQSLPMILGHGGLELRARAHIVLAKCYLSDPKFSGIS